MDSSWELWDSTGEKTDSGWDTVTVEAAKDFKTTTVNAATVAAAWPIGSLLLPGQRFWTTGVRPARKSGNIWIASVTGKGLAGSRPVKVSGRSGVEQQNAESAVVPGLAGTHRVQAMVVSPTVDIEYISFMQPPTGRVGQAGLPQYAIPVRQSPWTLILNPLIHFPYGWVMVDLTWDKLPGIGVWLIKETWQYIYQKSI